MKRRITTVYIMAEGGKETEMDKDELFRTSTYDTTDQFGQDASFGGYVS